MDISLALVAEYAWDGRCPSIRAQVLANPSRFEELMPQQYLNMMASITATPPPPPAACLAALEVEYREAVADTEAWAAEARADIEAQKARGEYESWDLTPDHELGEIEEERLRALQEAAAYYYDNVEAATAHAARKKKLAAAKSHKKTDSRATELKVLDAAIIRRDESEAAELRALRAELEATKAELLATKAELAAARPKIGAATPALAALAAAHAY